jgi:hypothetical protein
VFHSLNWGFIQFCKLQQQTIMEKSSQRRIDFVLKRKRDGTNENEDPLVAANDILPLLQLE